MVKHTDIKSRYRQLLCNWYRRTNVKLRLIENTSGKHTYKRMEDKQVKL